MRTVEHPVAVRSASVRSDSLRSATVGEDGQVRVWDLATGILLQTFSRMRSLELPCGAAERRSDTGFRQATSRVEDVDYSSHRCR